MKEFKKRKFQKKKMFDVQQLLIGLNDLIAKKRKKKGKKESNCPQNKMCCYKV